MLTKLHGKKWQGASGNSLKAIAICPLLTAACIAPAERQNARWDLWFAEYVLAEPTKHASYALLTVFENRVVVSPKGDSVEARERSDLGQSFSLYEKSGAYYADVLPIFAPSQGVTNVDGVHFNCSARIVADSYDVSCRSKSVNAVFQSKYDPTKGVRWFDYYCGSPAEICRYHFRNGSMLLRPEFIETLKREGAIKSKPM